jgi:secreted trypsin-like serine protease
MTAQQLVVFILMGCILLDSSSVQGSIFSCNTTSACGCSRYNANINARIVGGEVAVSHSWGWAVSLRDNRGRSICGGSIISRYQVLTAAHCVYDDPTASAYSVVVGSDRTDTTEGQRLFLSRIVMHSSYNSFTKENDIAILYLRTQIDFTDSNVARICLPKVTLSERGKYPATGSSIVAIGWGTTSSSGIASPALRQVTVKTVNEKDSKCRPSINNADLQFCAAVSGGGKGQWKH